MSTTFNNNNNNSGAGAIPKSPQLPTTNQTPQAQTFQSYIDLLADKESNDETKLKAVQEISNNFEVIIHQNQLSYLSKYLSISILLAIYAIDTNMSKLVKRCNKQVFNNIK